MIIAVDGGAARVEDAEHLLHELLGALGRPRGVAQPVGSPLLACTHMVALGNGRAAVSLTWLHPVDTDDVWRRLGGWADEHPAGLVASLPGATEPLVRGADDLVEGAYVALAERALGTAGRLVRFPGQSGLRGRLPAGDVVRRSRVDAVEAIGGARVTDDSVVDTLDFVRPVWRAGRVVLLVQPAAGGVLVPFEAEHQIPCCTAH